MYISEIQKRLMNAIGVCGDHNGVLKLAVENGANQKEMTDTYHLALWFEGAPAKVKLALCKLFDERHIYEHGLRICNHCGRFMTEGYILVVGYACSYEHAAILIKGNTSKDGCDIPTDAEAEVLLDAVLEDYPDDNFWTEWHQEL